MRALLPASFISFYSVLVIQLTKFCLCRIGSGGRQSIGSDYCGRRNPTSLPTTQKRFRMCSIPIDGWQLKTRRNHLFQLLLCQGTSARSVRQNPLRRFVLSQLQYVIPSCFELPTLIALVECHSGPVRYVGRQQ